VEDRWREAGRVSRAPKVSASVINSLRRLNRYKEMERRRVGTGPAENVCGDGQAGCACLGGDFGR
jgi:hypothetical protein